MCPNSISSVLHRDDMNKTQVVVMLAEEEREGRDSLSPWGIQSADGHFVLRPSTPAMAVVHGVATVLETDPDALDPLVNTVDPDALNQLVETWIDREEETASVTFEYCGCSVTAYGSGKLVIDKDDRDDVDQTI